MLMASTTFNFTEAMGQRVKSVLEASGSESEPKDSSNDENNEESQNAYDLVYEESCK